MRWLAEGSVAALAGALREVAPELAGYPIVIPGEGDAGADPQWWGSSAFIGTEFVAKFAWSRPAALRVRHELGVLTALALVVPHLPEVVVGSTDPLLLVTRRVPGTSLFAVADSIDRNDAGCQLARFLAALQDPAARARVEAETGPVPAARPLAATEVLRDRFAAWVDPERHRSVRRWCDWSDAVLAEPGGPTVLVHADLHGNNQVWDRGELRLVVDFETVGVAEPEYDLVGFPGPAMGPGVAYLPAQVAGRITGAVMANLMFARAAVSISVKHRATGAHFLSEVIATAGRCRDSR